MSADKSTQLVDKNQVVAGNDTQHDTNESKTDVAHIAEVKDSGSEKGNFVEFN